MLTTIKLQAVNLLIKIRQKTLLDSAAYSWIFIFFLALIIWFSRFFYYKDFGLYEDDYFFVGRTINQTFSELIKELSGLSLATQGRPIGFGIAFIAAWIGNRLGGLNFIYIIGYIIILVNAILFYLLLKRLFPEIYATLGGLAFSVFPSDTTQSFLTHSLALQPSLTFFLIATHFYLSKKQSLSYLFITLSLLTYEQVFPLFFAIPIISHDRSNVKNKIIKHSIILIIVFFIVYILRLISGEERTSHVSFSANILKNILYGPFISIFLFLFRPIYAFFGIINEPHIAYKNAMILIGFFVCLFFLFLRTRKYFYLHKKYRLNSQINFCLFEINLPLFVKYFIYIIAIGIAVSFLSYLFTFTTSVFSIAGRSSRVHFASVFGSSVIIGAVCSLALYITNYFRNKFLSFKMVSIVLAALFTLLIAFGLFIQQNYKDSWRFQKDFWSNLIEICPDIADGTNIFVEVEYGKLPKSTFIETLSWPTPFIFEDIYSFPESWKYIPRVWIVDKGWLLNTSRENNQLKWPTPEWFWPFKEVTILPSNTILVKMLDKQLFRFNESMNIQGINFDFKKSFLDKSLPIYPKKKLYYIITHNKNFYCPLNKS